MQKTATAFTKNEDGFVFLRSFEPSELKLRLLLLLLHTLKYYVFHSYITDWNVVSLIQKKFQRFKK